LNWYIRLLYFTFLITPDSAISREQETGGSGHITVDCPRACGGGLRLRKRAMLAARGAISDRTICPCSPYWAPCCAWYRPVSGHPEKEMDPTDRQPSLALPYGQTVKNDAIHNNILPTPNANLYLSLSYDPYHEVRAYRSVNT